MPAVLLDPVLLLCSMREIWAFAFLAVEWKRKKGKNGQKKVMIRVEFSVNRHVKKFKKHLKLKNKITKI